MKFTDAQKAKIHKEYVKLNESMKKETEAAAVTHERFIALKTSSQITADSPKKLIDGLLQLFGEWYVPKEEE